jgi:hypothetical protein
MTQMLSLAELLAHPLMGMWSVDGGDQEHAGVLSFDAGVVYLTLYFAIDGNAVMGSGWRTDPALVLFLAPNQPTVHGRTKAGQVTLFNCAELNYQSTNRLSPPSTQIELTLRPTQAWIGDGFVKPEQTYKELSFEASGLHNVLSTVRVDHQFLVKSTRKHKSVTHRLKVLTGAQQAFLVYDHERPHAVATNLGKQYNIVFSSTVAQSHSATGGSSFATTDEVLIGSEGASLPELMSVSYQLEQFLSIMCLGPFRATRLRVRLDIVHTAQLLWTLGRAQKAVSFVSMPHQILVPLGQHPQLASRAIETWFKASNIRRLARWLIFESLFEETTSTAKFLSIAQAWEIIGREEDKSALYDRKLFKKACDAAAKAIKAHLGSNAADRLVQLLRSSNRQSFATFVKNITGKVPALALSEICGDVEQFVSFVVKTRNVLTHMQGNKKFSLEMASYFSLFLTYKLTALFCIHECTSLGLPLDNLAGMLANNEMARFARRPLPSLMTF